MKFPLCNFSSCVCFERWIWVDGETRCFQCFRRKKKNKSTSDEVFVAMPKQIPSASRSAVKDNHNKQDEAPPKHFKFHELAKATKKFRKECLLGEDGFGRIFKGTLKGSEKIVAVRQLDRHSVQGEKDFETEVARINLLKHKNLVKLIGYCADGDQRILVYEYMTRGSLKNDLFRTSAGKNPLDWHTRMKVALGVAQGLEYLHEKVDPPIIYRELKSSTILLDEDNNPKLADYGLATIVEAPKVMAGYGYCAPEYERNGALTEKCDVYSFGVVLLELISGRMALDTTRPADEQNLVSWVQPFFKDQTKFSEIADPLLENTFPATSLNQAVGVAAMCLQEEPSARPLISDVSATLTFLTTAQPETPIPTQLAPML